MSGKETLLDRAIRNFRVAEKNLSFLEEDDFYINVVGYFIQQSVELYLKHYLEINGYVYKRTHDINELLSEIVRNNIDINMSEDDIEYLDLMSETITKWESKTRCIKNYFLESRRVQQVLKRLKPTFNP